MVMCMVWHFCGRSKEDRADNTVDPRLLKCSLTSCASDIAMSVPRSDAKPNWAGAPALWIAL